MNDLYQHTDYIDPAEVERLFQLYTITPEDLEHIRSFGQVVLPKINELGDRFYDWLETQPEYDQFFSEPDTLKRVREAQVEYWIIFFAGQIDEQYFQNRYQVGATHARIGLPMLTYFAGMNAFMDILYDELNETTSSEMDRTKTTYAIAKLLHFDMALIVQTYTQMVNEQISSQTRSLMEMSTPVTRIWSGIILLPIVGIIDSKRAQDIMNSALDKISQIQARVFIIDISGVAVVDTAVANNLIKITKATRLMGCESIISGVSPAIAQTIVELGIDVGTVKTTSTMQDALSDAFRRTGMEINEIG